MFNKSFWCLRILWIIHFCDCLPFIWPGFLGYIQIMTSIPHFWTQGWVFSKILPGIFFSFSVIVNFIDVSYSICPIARWVSQTQNLNTPCLVFRFLPVMTDHSGFTKSQPRDVGSVRESETWRQNYFAQLWVRVQHLNFSSKGGNLNYEQVCLHTVHATNHQRLPMQMSSSWIRLWIVVDLAQYISRKPSKTNS